MNPASFKRRQSAFNADHRCDNDDDDGDVPVFDSQNINISFNGCGFLGIYHVGVAAALRAYVPDMKIGAVCGASAGAIAATCLLGDVPCEKFAHELMLGASECRKLVGGPINPKFQVCQRLEDSMMRLLPEDIHKKANGKLFVSLTSVYTGENIIISNYTSKKELVDSVIASTFIPVFSGIFPTRIRGVPVIDGGFSVNQVVINSDTITVSPLAGDAHICPMDDLVSDTDIVRLYVAQAGTNISWENMWRLTQVLYPPKTKVLSDLMMQGFLDCTRFLCNFGVIDRSLSCLTVQSHFQQKPEKHSDYEKSSYPETLTRVVTNFLERELPEDGNGESPLNSQGMRGQICRLLRNIVYYQPCFVMCRLSFRAANFMLNAIIAGLLELLPRLTGENNKFLKLKVEQFLGVLIGYFGPIIGYEFKFVEKPDRSGRNRGRYVGPPVNVSPGEPTIDQPKHHAKFNCDVHIHQFSRGDRETANRQRRMSMLQRRKSLSMDQLEEPMPQAFLSSQSAARRYSVTPNIERTFPSHNPLIVVEDGKEDEDELSSCMTSNGDDDSEILSLQVESYVDTPADLPMPCSTEEALRLQVDNLEVASHSRDVSGKVSRRGSLYPTPGRQTPSEISRSRRGSGSASCIPSFMTPDNMNKTPDEETLERPSETLQNIVRMTRHRDSIFNTFYTDENGELVTVSLYDVDDPVSLIGNDVLGIEERPNEGHDATDFNEDVVARLDRLHQLYGDNRYQIDEEDDAETADSERK